MKITKATILVGRGADYIMLMTDLPCSTWPYEGFQSLNTEAAAGTGEAYVKRWFPFVEIIVIDLETGDHKRID